MPYAFTTESVEYIRHGSTPYIAKLYKPSGDGPFPMVIDLHGGAWCNGDLADCDGRDQVPVSYTHLDVYKRQTLPLR